MIAKGKAIAEEVGNNEKVKSTMDKLKETGNTLTDKAEDLMDGLEGYVTGKGEEE